MTNKIDNYLDDLIKLAHKFCNYNRKYANLFYGYEDMHSTMVVYGIRALPKFDSSIAELSTYLYTVFNNRIRIAIRKLKQQKKYNIEFVSLNTPINTEDADIELQDIIPDKQDVLQDLQKKEFLNFVKHNISDVSRLYFFEDKTQKEIADLKGITQTSVSRIIKRNIIRLRYLFRLGDEYYNKSNKIEDSTKYKIDQIMKETGCCKRTAFRKLAKMRNNNENRSK